MTAQQGHLPPSRDPFPCDGADNPLSAAFWTRPPHQRDAVFARLRAQDAPVFLHRPATGAWQVGDGFYALTRYSHVLAAGRDTQAFSSEPTAVSLEAPPPQIRQDQAAIINLDNPRHARLRKIVSRMFTPAKIQQLEAHMAVQARRIVDDLLDRGPCDFARDVAPALPIQVICTMTGIPDADRPVVLHAVDLLFQATDMDSRVDPRQLAQALDTVGRLIADLVRTRRAHPTDDLISAVATSQGAGAYLNETEAITFFLALVGGGNETVRNTLCHALSQLTDHPDQYRLLLGDLPARLPTAIEEFVRHASSVSWVRRTVRHPTQLGDQIFQIGDKVILYYASANMDDTVFSSPQTLDILRNPNPHLGFGTPNPHFCLGAHLARRELTALLTELLTRIPTLHATAPPTYHPRGATQDITHLPCAW
ncbi:cytochrome P450 [Streptomyces natalensis]|uniref:cytochrome P450 n=1 Tax=Streptomyces natalensis TaxID=68242 RepID=UPI0005C9BCDB|nr:cytochrome P450 [Streptomyces natalensis]